MERRISNPLQWGWTLFVSLLVLGLSGCQQRPSCESVAATSTAAVLATGIPQPLTLEQVETRWKSGAHAHSYVQDEMQGNSTCAACHAPLEWQPLKSELPEAWAQTGLPGLSLPIEIAESDWSSVSCEVCHPQRREAMDGEIAWLEVPPISSYSQVDSSTRLCEHCHLAESGEDHTALVFEGVHAELDCSDCHDVHDGSASCGESGCHLPFSEECELIETHDKPHSVVTCSGCHDGLGLPIGWNTERQQWDTFMGGDPKFDQAAQPFNSHSLTLEVDCDRCHAPGDHPWDPS